jgi:hypothetical protein
VHACRDAHPRHWLAPELREIELSGDVVASTFKLVGPAARLVRRVQGWPALQRDIARDCAARTLDRASSDLREAGLGDLADRALAAASTAELQDVALAAADRAPALTATLIGYAVDCAWDIDKGYYAMCAYVAATAFANTTTGDVVQDMTSDGWVRERSPRRVRIVTQALVSAG